MKRTQRLAGRSLLMLRRLLLIVLFFVQSISIVCQADEPPFVDYCQRLQHEIQGKKHGFLAGNVTYYVGGFHASWNLVEHETLGLTHPFHHDLRSRGVGLKKSVGKDEHDTGIGNDFSGWEFYKDTRVLYGSVVIDGKVHRHPVPSKMYWRPDRMICEFDIAGVKLREEKFIAANDTASTIIVSSKPVTLRFDGQSFFGRHGLKSSATIKYDAAQNAIHIVEGGTTRCRPETDRSHQTAPIMYEGMSTILTASRDFSKRHRFRDGPNGQRQYEFDVDCDKTGVILVWSMHDKREVAIRNAVSTLKDPRNRMASKTKEMNRQLNLEIPWFRCSDKKFEDIYYYLWSLYLMYYIDVGRGWEMEPHTQTAVNNFLGMHRYDATFQIKVGAWTANKQNYAYGNVLTWKHLVTAGHYRQAENGTIALSDNKGVAWHSGVYGNELSEHVLGAWQIYQHSGDLSFLRDCYEGYFRKVFWRSIPPFFSNHFEVALALKSMARLTGHPEDVAHWDQLVPANEKEIRNWFDQRWEMNGHSNYFAGPKNGMLMTTGFWHMRSNHFPRNYATKMVTSWALDREKGFYGDFFPLAMSRQSMKRFETRVDHSFGYTPDTAYFLLSGMFRQRLNDSASKLTLNHLENYNYHADWKMPVAPEAYTRAGKLFGDQYSNFNAGKILLFLEGLAGIEYSVVGKRLEVHDAMPLDWDWMEFRLPIQINAEKGRTVWPVIRYEKKKHAAGISKSIRVTECPLPVTIEPWTEGRRVQSVKLNPAKSESNGARVLKSRFSNSDRFEFEKSQSNCEVVLLLSSDRTETGK